MAKANVDPQELEDFARNLSRFNQEMASLMQQLKGRMRRLEGSWHDQEQAKFQAEFDAQARVIGKFLEHSELHARALKQKAAHVKSYLGR
ncbi:WXG100 family type VII secretion target [Phycisphaera mikurensis]|uniref:ESAT-6-like protein n=1 Tax=Phycisphaera mikurensis (strain NBRC 102666 / KCTC 22515 / FYK2301M01) TaxID=1142394 RepID=I0IH08_PHYMF|nr:WXG100 family type VII secretion target [Phycisphaera mikurensis]MBB6440802.1 uncharacterized protein YukE [Phycisphaera mikurensis]BAM04546.1 hypothetical protein PSMK_23870 [Phycisphaera mikurensis NBRC 102666]